MSDENNDVITMDWNNRAFCTIRLQGGTITSWRIYNTEILFVSKLSEFNWLSPVYGGIQVIFPQFTELGEQENDFANLMKWELVKGPNVLEYGDMECVIALNSTDPYTLVRYSMPFKIVMHIKLLEFDLFVFAEIYNPSNNQKMDFNYSLRTYLNVPLKESYFDGFQFTRYLDYARDSHGIFGDHPFIERKELDILFLKRKSTSVQIGHYYLQDILRLRTINFPELYLWNENSKMIPPYFKIDVDERLKWICFEPMFKDPIELDGKCVIGGGLFLSHRTGPCRWGEKPHVGDSEHPDICI